MNSRWRSDERSDSKTTPQRPRHPNATPPFGPMATSTFRFTGKMPATSDQVARPRRRVSHLEAVGLSRREIARRAGVAPTTITNLMAPKPRISKPVAVKLAAVR